MGHYTDRLSEGLGRSVEIGRLGGDEFAFIIDDALTPEIEFLIRSVLSHLSQSFSISGLQLEVGFSVGVATFPGAGLAVDTLLRSADAAKYEAKREGSGFVITSKTEVGAQRSFNLGELRRALNEREFTIYYQPISPLQKTADFGFEALIRWNHPLLGLVTPQKFMAAVELSELIHPLTEWIISSVLFNFKPIVDKYPDAFVSVNISMRNLIDQQFVLRVQRILSESSFPAKNLKLEMTESVVMTDPERTLKALKEIHNLGIKIAVDDFGTGYSSLSYLQKLPVHSLKIDRSFVNDMLEREASRTIVLSIVSLAHSLGLSVIAEGIESLETMRMLEEAKCDYAQGYFLGRPMPFESVHGWIHDFFEMRGALLER